MYIIEYHDLKPGGGDRGSVVDTFFSHQSAEGRILFRPKSFNACAASMEREGLRHVDAVASSHQ